MQFICPSCGLEQNNYYQHESHLKNCQCPDVISCRFPNCIAPPFKAQKNVKWSNYLQHVRSVHLGYSRRSHMPSPPLEDTKQNLPNLEYIEMEVDQNLGEIGIVNNDKLVDSLSEILK